MDLTTVRGARALGQPDTRYTLSLPDVQPPESVEARTRGTGDRGWDLTSPVSSGSSRLQSRFPVSHFASPTAGAVGTGPRRGSRLPSAIGRVGSDPGTTRPPVPGRLGRSAVVFAKTETCTERVEEVRTIPPVSPVQPLSTHGPVRGSDSLSIPTPPSLIGGVPSFVSRLSVFISYLSFVYSGFVDLSTHGPSAHVHTHVQSNP